MRSKTILLLLGVAIAQLIVLAQSQTEKLNLSYSTGFVVFPQDCNSHPPMMFGGKALAEMDRCAGITVRRLLYSSINNQTAVTVAIDKLVFHRSAQVNDLLLVKGVVTDLTEKSIKVFVVIERETSNEKRELIVSGIFTYVAYDPETKKAVPHGLKLNGK